MEDKKGQKCVNVKEPIEMTEEAPPPLWGSCRLNVALISFAAVFHMMLLRFNLSMGLVCMVKATANATVADEEAAEAASSGTFRV